MRNSRKFCRIIHGPVWPKLGRMRSTSGQLRPIVADIGQVWPRLAQLGADFDRFGSELDQLRPDSTRSGPISADIQPKSPTFGKVGAGSTKFAANAGGVGQTCTESTKPEPITTDLGGMFSPYSTNQCLAQIRPNVLAIRAAEPRATSGWWALVGQRRGAQECKVEHLVGSPSGQSMRRPSKVHGKLRALAWWIVLKVMRARCHL